jgi:flagellar L-ring protein precursor FlgH
MQPLSILLRRTVVSALLAASSLFASGLNLPKLPKQHPKTPEQLRAEYIARLQQQYVPAAGESTVGSLWSPQSLLGDFSSDYKAHNLNDTITILVSVQTTAAQSGTVDSQRTLTSNSSITGIMGRVPASTNPLLAGQSSSVLKGQGATASNTTFATSLTGQVIAVFPNGNLAVQAERQIFMNNQHENVTVRGMIRPGDIGPSNTVPSAALSNLEIEMKGKGIISDGVRPPNPITRAVLWLLNF